MPNLLCAGSHNPIHHGWMTKGPGRPTSSTLAPFGERLRQAIDESRFRNRAEFLAELRMQPPVMYRYEKGEQSPRMQDVEAWARLLEVSPAWLGMGTGPMRTALLDAVTLEATGTVSYDEDVEWAADQAGLDEEQKAALARVQRSIGRASRPLLLQAAMEIRAEGRGKSVDPPPAQKRQTAFDRRGKKS